MASVLIRREIESDYPAIASVVKAAFRSDDEAQLVSAIRASENRIPELSLVAADDHSIVGHVMVSWGTLRDGSKDHRVAILAPLAVLPSRQREGIGTRLVETVAAAADQRGEPLLLVQGDPRFYGRVGFEPAAPYGISQPLPEWAAPEASQLLRLSSYRSSLRGDVIYSPAFDVVE